jgi:amino acid transporter
MEIIQNLIHWVTSNDWGSILVLALAVLGALDALLLAVLALSNKLWPDVKWDDNAITFLHQWLSKIVKKS